MSKYPLKNFCAIACCVLFPFAFLTSAEATGDDAKPADVAGLADIRISEIMYHPLDAGALDGDSLEFIELKNTGGTPVDLNGVAFTNGIDFAFGSGAVLAAGGFIILAGNAVEFENFYGFPPFGDYDGRLDNAGERITLSDGSGVVLKTFVYADRYPWPIGPDGAGFSLVPVSEAAGLDLSDPENWRGSRWGGSPGEDEPAVPAIPPVRINEVLAHTDPPFKDAVELFNPTASAVDLSGWYLTDEKETPRKFKLPASTSIAASGYLVFDEDDFNPTPGVPPSFALSSFGDAIYLFSADGQDNLTGYVRGFAFGGTDNGVTLGRETWATGEEELLPQISETLGRGNSGARIGPVVISEIMYGPPTGQDEFLELINISSQTIALFDQQFPENTWHIEGIDFSFPPNAEIGPGSIALVVPLPPDVFRAAHGIPAQVAIYGPYAGRLNNAGESIQLQAPEDPNLDGTVPYFNIDEVIYGDEAPWPESADGGGSSIYKTNLDGLSNDPSNWRALANGGTPGFADLGSVSTEQPGTVSSNINLEPAYPNPFNRAATVSFTAGSPGPVRVRLFDILGREIQILFDKTVPAGIPQQVRLVRGNLPAGTYFIQVESAGTSNTVQPIVIR